MHIHKNGEEWAEWIPGRGWGLIDNDNKQDSWLFRGYFRKACPEERGNEWYDRAEAQRLGQGITKLLNQSFPDEKYELIFSPRFPLPSPKPVHFR